LVAARRFQDKLKKELNNEKKIKTLLTRSEISIKNKISVLILSKNLDFNYLIEFQKKIKNENASFYILEGTDNYTLIIPEKYSQKLLGKFESKLIQSNHNLALINFKSPKEIEKISGVISYLTSLFATNGVNILEFLSCWKDTIFVIDKNDVNKAISFLDF
jgi:aspartokinase